MTCTVTCTMTCATASTRSRTSACEAAHPHTASTAARRTALGGTHPSTLMSLLRHCLWIVNRQAQRRALRELDDRLLRDIGISRGQALQEGRKRFWQ